MIEFHNIDEGFCGHRRRKVMRCFAAIDIGEGRNKDTDRVHPTGKFTVPPRRIFTRTHKWSNFCGWKWKFVQLGGEFEVFAIRKLMDGSGALLVTS
jgi:hypothetical protein